MVKSERYTCNICNKTYSSASSIWNHRTKIHKTNDNTLIIPDNTFSTNDNTSIIHSLSEIESVKTYNCLYCNREFNNYQNRWKHHKICKTKNHEIIQNPNNNSQIIQNQNNNSQIIENQNNGTVNNTTNNGTINNNNGTINNNITINNYGQEDLSYIKDDIIKTVLERLTYHDDDSMKSAIPRLARMIHFNPNHKENNNVEINSVRSKTAKKMVDGKMKHVIKDQLIKDIHAKIIDFLQNYINKHRLEITRKMTECLKHYKLKNPEYIKKVILEEINLLGYVFYKNNIDIEFEQ